MIHHDVRGSCALYYQYDIHALHGVSKYHSRKFLSQSFLIAYARFLFLKMAVTSNQSITDTGGTSRSVTSSIGSWLMEASAGTSTSGLVVGTGTNAVTLNDTALQTQIAHGTGSGQLSYGGSVVELPSSDATSTTLILTRVFSNSSGGSITVQELGAYAYQSTWEFCIVRDVQTIIIADGEQLTLNYILKTTI